MAVQPQAGADLGADRNVGRSASSSSQVEGSSVTPGHPEEESRSSRETTKESTDARWRIEAAQACLRPPRSGGSPTHGPQTRARPELKVVLRAADGHPWWQLTQCRTHHHRPEPCWQRPSVDNAWEICVSVRCRRRRWRRSTGRHGHRLTHLVHPARWSAVRAVWSSTVTRTVTDWRDPVDPQAALEAVVPASTVTLAWHSTLVTPTRR